MNTEPEQIREEQFYSVSYLRFLFFSSKGRVNRKRYLISGLLLAPLYIATQILSNYCGPAITTILYCFSGYMGLMVNIKRAHDRDRSGHFCWLLLVPVLSLWPGIELIFFKGTSDNNRFGIDMLPQKTASANTTKYDPPNDIKDVAGISSKVRPELKGSGCIGIYLSRKSATVVCVSLTEKGPDVTGCFEVSVESDEGSSMKTLAFRIAQGCAERKLIFSRVSVALDCSLFMQHNVHSEFNDIKQIASTIRFDTEEALATDVTDVAIAFRINSSGDSGSDLTVFTVNQEVLREILVAFGNNNIDPEFVEPDVNCLLRYIDKKSSFSNNEKPLFGLFSDHNGYFVISGGPGRAGESFMRTFVVSSSQDRGRLLRREVPVINALRSGGEGLNCLKVFDSFGSLNSEQLGQQLGMQVSDIDLKEFAGSGSQALADGIGGVEFSIAFGAALSDLEKSVSVNFRGDFMPFMGKKIQMLKNLKVVSMSAVAVLLILGAYYQIQLIQANKPRSQLRMRFSKEYSAVMMGEKFPVRRSPVKKLLSEYRRIKNIKSGQLSVTGEQSIGAKLTLIFEAFNKCASQTNLNVEKISITAKNVRIVGDTSNRRNTLKVFDAFRDKMEVLQYRYDTKGNRDGFTLTVSPKK